MSNLFRIRYSTRVNNEYSVIQTDPWMLDSRITYLNHGSFGARVKPIFDYQMELKREFEFSPVNFLDRQPSRVDEARQIVAAFLGAQPEGFGFVDNATTGIGCVVNSISFSKGDEILTTNHVYNGVRQVLTKIANESGCSYREVAIPLPLNDSEEIVQAILGSLTDETKLLVIDHVSSSSAILFPVHEIARICREKGILLLVDGAHAAGMLDLNIDSIGCDWYVGNLHKWVCAPIGAGFVWTSERYRETTHPMTVSHWLYQGYVQEFNWQGTKDVSAWLSAAKAVQWGSEIGWNRIRKHNHALVTRMHAYLIDRWDVEPISPLDGSMLGSMATISLPKYCPSKMDQCLALRDELYLRNSIEVPIFEFQNRGVVRVSAQLYSDFNDVKALNGAINDIYISK